MQIEIDRRKLNSEIAKQLGERRKDVNYFDKGPDQDRFFLHALSHVKEGYGPYVITVFQSPDTLTKVTACLVAMGLVEVPAVKL